MITLYVENNGGASVFEYLNQTHNEADVNEVSIDTDTGSSNGNVLPTDLRILFVNCLADYTASLFGLRPTDDRLKNIAQSAVALIPSLASKCSESEIVITVPHR